LKNSDMKSLAKLQTVLQLDRVLEGWQIAVVTPANRKGCGGKLVKCRLIHLTSVSGICL